MKQSNTERIWNVVSMFVYVLLLIALGTLLKDRGTGIEDIRITDLVLICIATYRMTRLMVYDRIFKLFRDIARDFQDNGFGASIRTILTCPWCAGVWLSLFNVAIFFLVPFGKLFIYIMAIAGVAIFLQLGANILAMTADEKQMDVKEKRERTGFTKPM